MSPVPGNPKLLAQHEWPFVETLENRGDSMGGKHTEMSDSQASQAPSEDRVGEFFNRPGLTNRRQDPATQTSDFDVDLSDALQADQISAARTLVANAEAVLAAHEAEEDAKALDVSRADVAAAKARIAIATGDGAAARAILVQAIEAAPKVVALRTLMTEVMLATGRAADVRPVLQHLGHAVQPKGETQHAEGKAKDSSR